MWRFASTERAMVVGVPKGQLAAGSARIFERDGEVRIQRYEVIASDGEPGDCFGFQVAVEGDAIVATAPCAEGKRGAAYVYRWDGFSWSEEQKLVAPDGREGAFFGGSVDIAGGVVVVGADRADSHGAVYVYRRTGSSWGAEQRLSAPGGRPRDEFGYATSMQDDEIVVGAPSSDGRGAAHVYRWNDDRWTQTQMLSISQEVRGSNFGQHVAHALDEQGLIIGASRENDHGATYAVAHLFQRTDELWGHVGTVEPIAA